MLSFFKCMRCFSMYNLFSRHNFFVRRLSRTRHTIFLLLYTRYRLWDPRVSFFLPSAATDDPLPSISLPAAPTPLRPLGGGSEGEQRAAAVLLRKEQGSRGKSKAR